MDKKIYDTYVELLKQELVPALGCTEPIAIAFATAKAREILGCMPEKVMLHCSGSIIKNVKSVTVPNSDGMKGIEVAALMGVVGGDASRELEALESIRPEHLETVRAMVASGMCRYDVADDPADLYILVDMCGEGHTVQLEVKDTHTNITRIVKDQELLFERKDAHSASFSGQKALDKDLLNVRDILIFANEVDLEDVREVLERQIAFNTAISQEGLANGYGVKVGEHLMKNGGENDVRIRACAAAAAGSDARMSGCALPVVINSGSGNQGMTVSLPVIEYAKYLQVDHDKLLRALALANLLALHQKRYIGSLSAFCGAICAGAAAGAGIVYLHDGSYEEICGTITNALGAVGGVVCDGAKPSCAAKIAAAIQAALLGWDMSKSGDVYADGEGMVKGDIEHTIQSITRMGREGMKSTNSEILNIMVGK